MGIDFAKHISVFPPPIPKLEELLLINQGIIYS